MRSVMDHRFSQVPTVDIPRSTFSRDCGCKTTFDEGQLIPIFVDEALPGDSFKLRMSAFARLNTPVFPIMDNMVMETFFFAIPNRHVWDNWEKFCGERDDPSDSIDYTVPQIVAGGGGFSEGSLADYYGLPIGVGGLSISALFHRCYNLVYNQWFRDQNVRAKLTVDTDDGPDTESDYVIRRIYKRHDYFTSALPWPQREDAVDLPLGTTAPIRGIGRTGTGLFTGGSQTVTETDGTTETWPATWDTSVQGVYLEATGAGPGATLEIYADLNNATAATVNEVRTAFQVQRLLERDARGGTRYIEILKSHFGVTSPDARLQRTEYLGGGRSYVNISPIAQTSESGTTEQGNLAAMGTVGFDNHGFTKSFTEHCIILGLVAVRSDLTYQQGINRMFSRQTRYDYYWPSLAHLGEQTILNKELYAQGTSADDDVYGYQERYAEYRYKPSIITGQFRSTAATPLDAWHLAEEFGSLPTLGPSFLRQQSPLDRVVATPGEPHFIFDSYADLECTRPMPLYGVPGMIDHF